MVCFIGCCGAFSGSTGAFCLEVADLLSRYEGELFERKFKNQYKSYYVQIIK